MIEWYFPSYFLTSGMSPHQVKSIFLGKHIPYPFCLLLYDSLASSFSVSNPSISTSILFVWLMGLPSVLTS